MVLSVEAQALFDHARAAVPRWLTEPSTSAIEWLYAFVDEFDLVRTLGQEWLDNTYILLAPGAWIDQHARDRGTSRRAGESGAILAQRLKSISDNQTQPVLLGGIEEILRRQGNILPAFNTRKYSQIVGSIWDARLRATTANYDLTFSMIGDIFTGGPPTVVESGNNITVHFRSAVHSRADVEAAIVANCTKATLIQASTHPTSTVTSAANGFVNQPFQLELSLVNVRREKAYEHTPGSSTSFLSRGYRMCITGGPFRVIIILPYGTAVSTAGAVLEYLRLNAAAGFAYSYEIRGV